MEEVGRYNALVSRHRHVADFLTIYIREAHATDGEWPMTDDYDIKMHASLEDRLKSARLLEDAKVEGDIAVDAMTDPCVTSYGALPERLVVLSGDGTVAYMGRHGPWGYSLAEVEDVLQGMTK